MIMAFDLPRGKRFDSHPRGHVIAPDFPGPDRRPRYRAQIKDLAVGDTLATFGKVLEWREVESSSGWRMFRMVTERPQYYPVETNVFVMPQYVYFGVTDLA